MKKEYEEYFEACDALWALSIPHKTFFAAPMEEQGEMLFARKRELEETKDWPSLEPNYALLVVPVVSQGIAWRELPPLDDREMSRYYGTKTLRNIHDNMEAVAEEAGADFKAVRIALDAHIEQERDRVETDAAEDEHEGMSSETLNLLALVMKASGLPPPEAMEYGMQHLALSMSEMGVRAMMEKGELAQFFQYNGIESVEDLTQVMTEAAYLHLLPDHENEDAVRALQRYVQEEEDEYGPAHLQLKAYRFHTVCQGGFDAYPLTNLTDSHYQYGMQQFETEQAVRRAEEAERALAAERAKNAELTARLAQLEAPAKASGHGAETESGTAEERRQPPSFARRFTLSDAPRAPSPLTRFDRN